MGIEGECQGCTTSVDITGGGVEPSLAERGGGVTLPLMHLYVLHQQYLARWIKYLPFALGLLCLCVGLCSRELLRCALRCARRLDPRLLPRAGYSAAGYSAAPEAEDAALRAPLYKHGTGGTGGTGTGTDTGMGMGTGMGTGMGMGAMGGVGVPGMQGVLGMGGVAGYAELLHDRLDSLYLTLYGNMVKIDFLTFFEKIQKCLRSVTIFVLTVF